MVKNLIIAVLGVGLIVLAYLYTAASPKGVGTELPSTGDTTKEQLCAQVITPALNPETGDITEFPTPCDVPPGWEVIQNDIPDLELNLE